MPALVFNPNAPQPTDLLSNSQGTLLLNNQALDGIFGVDHTKFSNATANQGYHTIIHEISQGTWDAVNRTGTPAAISGINQIVALNYTPAYALAPTDTQLFAVTGNGGQSQLTGNVAAANGWAWSGGLLFQWGFISASPNSGGTFTFTSNTNCIPFPKTCFNVNATIAFNGSSMSATTSGMYTAVLSNTQFKWYITGIGSNITNIIGFYWWAVGQ